MPTKLDFLNYTEKKICKCLYDYEKSGSTPSQQEIADEIRISNRGMVSRYFDKLEKLGFISRKKRKHHNVRLTENGRLAVESFYRIGPLSRGIPVIATASAGEEPKFFISKNPNDAIDNDRIDIEDELQQKGSLAVRIEGDSMIGDHIIDGDYVFFEKQTSYNENDIVVVSKNEEQGLEESGYAILKRLSKVGGEIHLRPSNPKTSTKVISESKWEEEGWRIEGKVIAVYRRMSSSRKVRQK